MPRGHERHLHIMCKLQFGPPVFHAHVPPKPPGDKVYAGRQATSASTPSHFHEGSYSAAAWHERVRGHQQPAAGSGMPLKIWSLQRSENSIAALRTAMVPARVAPFSLPDFFLLRSEQESYTPPHDIEKPGNYEINPESCPVLGHDSLEQSADQLKDDQQLQNCYKGLSISDRIYPHTLYPEKNNVGYGVLEAGAAVIPFSVYTWSAAARFRGRRCRGACCPSASMGENPSHRSTGKRGDFGSVGRFLTLDSDRTCFPSRSG